MTVFEVARPLFGVTVTVTLQNPAFKPFKVVPDTLQYFAELETTFRTSFEVESTLSFANAAINLAVADFLLDKDGVAPTPDNTTVLKVLQFPALSLIRNSICETEDFPTAEDAALTPRSLPLSVNFSL